MKKTYSPVPGYDEELANAFTSSPTPQKPPKQSSSDASTQSSKQASLQASNNAVLQAINITILQNDVTDLKEPAIQAQTFRLTPKEIKQLKKLAYINSEDLGRKVGQGDVVRLGLLLVNKLEKGVLQDLLQEIM